MSTLLTALAKAKDTHPDIDVDHYYQGLIHFKEGVWFFPTGDDYALCQGLFELNLIEKVTRPVWQNNLFRGTAIWFRYYLDLKYVGAP